MINPLYQFVDMITFNDAMVSIGLATVSDTYLGMLNFLTHKFVMIPVMVATGFSMALIPVLRRIIQKTIKKELRVRLIKLIKLCCF